MKKHPKLKAGIHPGVELPFYPATPDIPLGAACLVWVVDRFNEGEYEDFDKDDVLDSAQNHTAYVSALAAKADVVTDIYDELKEIKEDGDPDEYNKKWDKWVPHWSRAVGKDGTESFYMEAPHDGSMYTVRAIPLYLK